jgi:hypothetical protein
MNEEKKQKERVQKIFSPSLQGHPGCTRALIPSDALKWECAKKWTQKMS